ncbi:MAG: hypothetical protein HeimC2_20330 [Candidatus Heimdallarchaeota archaeon LC_2]|nr:MAG: hypothetical protein HeimC2_20330 [Candidatus Heimdallarchaeota archaeon LC_2]
MFVQNTNKEYEITKIIYQKIIFASSFNFQKKILLRGLIKILIFITIFF